MKKKIILAVGAAVVAGGVIVHGMAGNAAESRIKQQLAELEADPEINVSQVEIDRALGKTSLSARLELAEAPALGGSLAMDVGYLTREGEGTMTFDGETLSGTVHFTAGLGNGRQDYAFDADELRAAEGALTLEQVEGDGYVDREREHFALNMLTGTLEFADADGKLRVSDVVTELEHDIDAEAGEGRSHMRLALDELSVVERNASTGVEAITLGSAEVRNTASLEGETLASTLYFGVQDVVIMGSEPGMAEFELTADGLDYAAFAAVTDELERHLEESEGQRALTAEQQKALTRDLRQTLVEHAHTLLAGSPTLSLDTLSLDSELPMLGRVMAELSGRLEFDGSDLSADATHALLAGMGPRARESVIETFGRPDMSAPEAQAEMASRVSGELTVVRLPPNLVGQLPPPLQALLVNREPPHVFGWKDGRALYDGEPLEEALAR